MSETTEYPVFRRRRRRRRDPFFRLAGWLFVRLAIVLFLLALAPFLLILVYSQINPPVTMVMLAERFSGTPVTSEWRDLPDISERLRLSVISSEDARFCDHDGVEWDTLNEMVDGYLEGERVRGASTIPMQTVKNLFLWNERSTIRKAAEIPLALFANMVWSKERMLEIYLNIAEWDTGIFGAPGAAQHYFGKDIRALQWREASLLAVTLPDPKARNPARPSAGLSRLASRLERRTRNSGDWLDCARDKTINAVE